MLLALSVDFCCRCCCQSSWQPARSLSLEGNHFHTFVQKQIDNATGLRIASPLIVLFKKDNSHIVLYYSN